MATLDREQKKIIRLIKAEGRHITDPKARKRYLLAAVETGIVESGLHNLPGGDADSQGWRQERASLYKNPRNLRASIRRFREEFQQQYSPGEASYTTAGQVQRPAAQYLHRYQDVRGQAAQLLGRTGGGDVSGGGGGMPGSPAQYGTIPGVDNSAVRQQALMGYLAQRGRPGALLDLKLSLDAAQDTPSRRVQTRGSRPGTTASSSGRGGGGVKGELYELFWQGAGGINVKNGQRVPQGFVDGHQDHVHIAAKQKDLLRLGRLAERMGLHVGQNPAFGGVERVHVQDSFHYGRHEKPGENDRALDVSGDAAQMRRFAHRVAKLYRV